MASYTLFCLVEGEESPFPVDIQTGATVHDLKKRIKEEKQHRLNDFDANELTLYKVNIIDNDELVANVKRELLEQPIVLRATDELDERFKGVLPKKTVHIVVRLPVILPSAGLKHSRGSEDDLTPSKRRKGPRHSGEKTILKPSIWSPREVTVTAIFELLLKHRIVQVRGTPASGKTTLLRLLEAHILQFRNEADVFVHGSWPLKPLESEPPEDRLKSMLPGYPTFDDKERFFLFDEGQTSYWDESLWLVFKNAVQTKIAPVYVIIFCSYGNENVRDPRIPTPLAFDAKVILERVDTGKSMSHGLLLDEKEFDEVLERQKPKLSITKDLRDFIYEFTRGHVGHTLAVVEFLIQKVESLMLSGHGYSLEDFQEHNPSFHNFTEYLANRSTVRRGLPHNAASYAPAMKALLLHGEILFSDKDIDQGILSKLGEAHQLGFIDLNAADRYTFTSPLVRQIWSWRLLPSPDYQLPYLELFTFVEATVKGFRPSQLTGSDRRVGASNHRPPEAQYQEEYYRCVHKITQGNVGISPEYATAAGTRVGRIDFFIPSKKWGIELTRDGSKLNEHASRFTSDGAYGQWLTTSDMLDYVLLDFRNTMPMQSHQGIRNLYHVVFSDGATKFRIYDNTLKVQAESNLMHHGS